MIAVQHLTVLVETSTNAQLLPDLKDERATVNVFAAWCAATSADLRSVSPAHRELASRCSVVMLP